MVVRLPVSALNQNTRNFAARSAAADQGDDWDPDDPNDPTAPEDDGELTDDRWDWDDTEWFDDEPPEPEPGDFWADELGPDE